MRTAGADRGKVTALVAGAGALDIAHFLWVRRATIFEHAPARARGSVVGMALWLALAGASAAAPRSRPARTLAWTCGMTQIALYAVHLKIGKGRLRGLPGTLLGAAAIAVGG